MNRSIAVALLTLAAVNQAQAESFAPMTGRTFGPQDTEELSLDVGYVTGSDFDFPAARVNRKINERLQVYANFAKVSAEPEELSVDADGSAYGVGAFYRLPDFQWLPNHDVAVQVSYNASSLETDDLQAQAQGGQVIDLSVEVESVAIAAGLVLSSPVPLSGNGLQWYLGAGVEKVDVDVNNRVTTQGFSGGKNSDSETEPTAQAGVVLPMGFGSAHVGLHYSDGAVYGIGVRYDFR